MSNVVEVNGLTMKFKDFLIASTSSPMYKITQVPFKRDLRFWNDSPWSENPDGAYKVEFLEMGRELVDRGVYQFWTRKDGFGGSVEYFETWDEYLSYAPSNESPDAIKKEIGLCQNYERGI